MPFLGLWTQQGNIITPATPSASVDVVGAGGSLSFFGATPAAQETLPGELAPSASLADVIAQLTADENALLAYNLVAR